MLLQRHWQVHRKAIHDGYTNVYPSIKDEIWHKLKPMKEDLSQVCGNERVCLVDAKKLLEGMKHEKFLLLNSTCF